MSPDQLLETAQILDDGAVQDIWYAPDEFEKDGWESRIGQRILRTQEAMQDAARELRLLAAEAK